MNPLEPTQRLAEHAVLAVLQVMNNSWLCYS